MKYKPKCYQWPLTYFLASLLVLFLVSSPFIHPRLIVAFSPSSPLFFIVLTSSYSFVACSSPFGTLFLLLSLPTQKVVFLFFIFFFYKVKRSNYFSHMGITIKFFPFILRTQFQQMLFAHSTLTDVEIEVALLSPLHAECKKLRFLPTVIFC